MYIMWKPKVPFYKWIRLDFSINISVCKFDSQCLTNVPFYITLSQNSIVAILL